jgi:phosphatidylglycerophosphate synthase
VLDRLVIDLLRPTLDGAARRLAAHRVHADTITWAGFAIGLGGAAAIASTQFSLGLVMLLASRVCDGLDGAVARQTTPTDRGAFLDITLDFLFYASVPLAFAVADPSANAFAAAVLLAAFIGTGSSFLAFAALAAKRGITSVAYPRKGIYYLGGLTEASETLICFAAMCLWPSAFAPFAYAFSVLCLLTLLTRLRSGWKSLGA